MLMLRTQPRADYPRIAGNIEFLSEQYTARPDYPRVAGNI